jgi:SAP domain
MVRGVAVALLLTAGTVESFLQVPCHNALVRSCSGAHVQQHTQLCPRATNLDDDDMLPMRGPLQGAPPDAPSSAPRPGPGRGRGRSSYSYGQGSGRFAGTSPEMRQIREEGSAPRPYYENRDGGAGRGRGRGRFSGRSDYGRGRGRSDGRGRGGRSSFSNNPSVRSWESGRQLLDNRGSGPRRSTGGVPWHLQEIQDEGMDLLGEYKPWWRSNLNPEAAIAKMRTLKVDELKAELTARGLPTSGLKAELLARLEEALRRYTLSDDGLLAAQVLPGLPDEQLPACFPAVYEDVYLGHGASGDSSVVQEQS